MTLKHSISEMKHENQISVKDIERWGNDAIDSMEVRGYERAKSFLIVELPKGAEIVGKNGKVVAQASEDGAIGFYEEKTGKVGIGKKADFSVIAGSVPTLADINTWNEREKNLSSAEQKLLNSYIKRQVSYKDGSVELQEIRDRMYNNLLQDKKYFDRALKAEQEYQSKTPEQKRIYDQMERSMKRMQERQMQHTGEVMRKELEQLNKREWDREVQRRKLDKLFRR